MQSYIVRIYRRAGKTLMGMVEASDGGQKKAFTDYDELWAILNSREGEYLTTDHPPDEVTGEGTGPEKGGMS